MDKQMSMAPERGSTLSEAMQDMHPHLRLCGAPGNALLSLPEDLLAYIWSLLKDEFPMPPGASIDQWSHFLSVLEPNWILPLLYWRIGSLPHESHPPEIIVDQMRMAFLASRARYLRMQRQLREILDAFQAQGIYVLVLRGPGLAWSVYTDPALRPYSDLDLLVHPEQMVKAREALEGLGYRCLSKRFEVTREFFREEDFVHEKNPRDNLLVDLHWVHWELHPFFASGGDVGIEDLFLRACKVESSTLTFETLHPVDALIHAALHLAMIHSRDMRLIWIYDIALLARHLLVPDDWEVLQERSVAWRARLAMEDSLKMARVWVGLQLPDGFDEFSGWPRPTADELATRAYIIRGHWVTVLLKRHLSRPSGLLKMVRSLLRLLFPPPDIVRYCYPPSRDWLLPLSYVRRWHRWFGELIVNRISSSRQRG